MKEFLYYDHKTIYTCQISHLIISCRWALSNVIGHSCSFFLTVIASHHMFFIVVTMFLKSFSSISSFWRSAGLSEDFSSTRSLLAVFGPTPGIFCTAFTSMVSIAFWSSFFINRCDSESGLGSDSWYLHHLLKNNLLLKRIECEINDRFMIFIHIREKEPYRRLCLCSRFLESVILYFYAEKIIDEENSSSDRLQWSCETMKHVNELYW